MGGSITHCSNSGSVLSESTESRGISGGIVATWANGNITEVFNSGSVEVKNFVTEDTNKCAIDTVGGIIGCLYANSETSEVSLSKAYNKGNIIGIEGEATGGAIGQINNSLKNPNIVSTYYYSENTSLKGIGSEATNYNTISEADETGRIYKANSFSNLQEFLQSL